MKSFIFARRDPIQEAKDELREAELALLESQSAMEYAASDVAYHTTRIARLKKYLNLAVQDAQGVREHIEGATDIRPVTLGSTRGR